MTIRLLAGADAGVSDIEKEELFTDYEQILFTRVVSVAERHGRAVKLLVVPAMNVFDAVARTAIQLQAREIVFGESAKMTPQDQALRLGAVWDRLPHDRALATHLAVYSSDGTVKRFSMGAHAPALSPDDVERIHQLWTQAIGVVGPELHHRDVVAAALASFEDELLGERRALAIDRLRRQASG
jgi:hypothetical protein